MGRAVWWALAFASLASGARYVDYSEGKMPEYGSAIDYEGPRDSPAAPAAADTDEYHEHAQDAALEYKYEENRANTGKRVKGIGESEDWENSIKKHKRYHDEEIQENFDNSYELTSNFKSNLNPSKPRLKLKPRKLYNEDSTPSRPRYIVRYGRNRKKDIGDIEKENYDEPVDDIEDDKYTDSKYDKFKAHNSYRETTLRTARRKPRDRFVKSEQNVDEEDPIVNLRRRPSKDEFRPERPEPEHTMQPSVRRSQYRQGSIRTRARADTDLRAGRTDSKNDDYSDYYDMKRVQGIKEKLIKENIVPHTTTTILSFPMWTPPRPRLLSDNEDDVLEDLRRLMKPNLGKIPQREPDEPIPRDEAESMTKTVITRVQTTIDDYKYDASPSFDFEVSRRAPIEKKSDVSPSFDFEPSRRALIEIKTKPRKATTTTTRTSTSTTVITTPSATVSESDKIEDQDTEYTTEMSLAEKSRLSILKKAEKKEMLKDSATKKPPVLMQVTNRLHTLVMVEPPTSVRPWQRVTIVNEDTSENLMKVKRLMRQKLVANAKSIHDLSENWDDMICDYIDMTLLETSSASVCTIRTLLILLSLIVIKA